MLNSRPRLGWRFLSAMMAIASPLKVDHLQASRRPAQAPVQGPQPAACQQGRGQQVRIDPADAHAPQTPRFNQTQDFIIRRHRGGGERPQRLQDHAALAQIPASELPDHERMRQNMALDQQSLKA